MKTAKEKSENDSADMVAITEAVILLADSSIYFAILLGRCAMLSFPVSVLVVVLRRTLLKKAIF